MNYLKPFQKCFYTFLNKPLTARSILLKYILQSKALKILGNKIL